MLKKIRIGIIIMGLLFEILGADEVITPNKLRNVASISKNLFWGETAEGKGYLFDKNNNIKEGFCLVDNFNSRGISVGSQNIKGNLEFYFIDTSGNKIKKLYYDYVSMNHIENYATVKKEKKYGIIDLDGREVLKPKYDQFLLKGIVKVGRKYGYVDRNYREVLKVEYDEIRDVGEGFLKVKKGNRWGIFDCFQNKLIVKPKYNVIGNAFRYGFIEVWSTEKYWFSDENRIEKKYFLDRNGNELFYRNVIGSAEGLTVVTTDDKCGVLNKNGDYLINLQKNYFKGFSEGISIVSINQKEGLIDKNGKVIKEPEDISIRKLTNGVAIFELNGLLGLYGAIDKNGKIIVAPKYTDISEFSEEMAIVQIGERSQIQAYGKRDPKIKYGAINMNGEEVIKPKYDYIQPFFQSGIAGFEHNGKFGLIDKNGKEIVKAIYESIGEDVLNEVVQIKEEKKVFKGKEITMYNGGFFFSEGLCLVKRNGLYGYIDINEFEIIPCRFSDARPFSEGMACVKYLGKVFFIDKTGKKVFEYNSFWKKDEKKIVQLIHYDLNSFEEGAVEFYQNEKFGYLDRQGNVLINPILNSNERIEIDHKNNVVIFWIKRERFVYPITEFFR